MSETIFTMPGKAGDALHQWPIAYHFAKQTGKKITLWLDEKSCAMVAPLFAAQPCVEAVELKPGIAHYNCGGQPYHFDLPTTSYADRTIYHLGLRSFPARQLTLECLATANVPVDVTAETLASEPCLFVDPLPAKRRLVLHGQPIYTHSRSTPAFWKFLAGIRGELKDLFEEVVFVGNERDREIGQRTYPEWTTFDDGGSFLELARLMAGSTAVIGCGSSVVALGQAMHLPTIRVHDAIGTASKSIWNGLGENQVNDTELELRRSWPLWRDRWLTTLKEV